MIAGLLSVLVVSGLSMDAIPGELCMNTVLAGSTIIVNCNFMPYFQVLKFEQFSSSPTVYQEVSY